MKTETVTSLKSISDFVRLAGGRPNSRYYRALRAARSLEKILSEPAPVVEGSKYRITAANGREFVRFVEKNDDVFKLANRENIEIVSFVKI